MFLIILSSLLVFTLILFLHFVCGIVEMSLELREATDLVTKCAKLLVHQLHGSFNLGNGILPEIFFLSIIHVYNRVLLFELLICMCEKSCLMLIESALDAIHVR
jgi:hypothetical protein